MKRNPYFRIPEAYDLVANHRQVWPPERPTSSENPSPGLGWRTDERDKKAVFPPPDLELSPCSGFSDLRIWERFGETRNEWNCPYNTLIFLMPTALGTLANYTDFQQPKEWPLTYWPNSSNQVFRALGIHMTASHSHEEGEQAG